MLLWQRLAAVVLRFLVIQVERVVRVVVQVLHTLITGEAMVELRIMAVMVVVVVGITMMIQVMVAGLTELHLAVVVVVKQSIQVQVQVVVRQVEFYLLGQ